MIYHLATLLLGPVFLVQGKYVRRVTPKLPEPEGGREGLCGEGPAFSVLIIGDSAAAGVGAASQDEALSGHLLGALSSRYAVIWKLLAQSGDTSTQLLDKMRCVPDAHFDAVVVSIGVNDVTSMTTTATWLNNLRALHTLLQQKFGAPQVYFSSLPPMHLFPALPHPLRWWLGRRALQFNRLLEEFAQNRPRCTFVAIPYPPDQQLIAADGFHPGPLAYRLWGAHLAELLHAQRDVKDSAAEAAALS